MAGTEARRRKNIFKVRLSDEELAQVREAADRAGLTPPSHARQLLVGTVVARSVRRPPIDRTAVAQLLALIGQAGSNLRDLARSPDATGSDVSREQRLLEALQHLAEMRDLLMTALGRQA